MIARTKRDLNWPKNNSVFLEGNHSFSFYNTTNVTMVCTSDNCKSEAEYISMIEDYIFPTPYEWILISFHVIVFIFGMLGNSAVCIFVYKNRSMRTTTNLFLMNLAVADFMVIILCLPPTVLWDVTDTWFFGGVMCKIVLYLQSVSISVSILTLTFIAVDRWYAICYPLRFKTTSTRVKSLSIIIWILSLLLVLPEAVFLDIHPDTTLRFNLHYLTDCNFTWTKKSSTIYQVYITLILYVVPLILISIVYYQIAKALWSDTTPGSSEISFRNSSTCRNKQSANAKVSKRQSINTNCEAQIRSRRKAAKMLMCVVFTFAVCYLPIHVINVLRYAIILPRNDLTIVSSLIAHWLCYANSASNPIIYNFMNGQFRKEFKNLFRCKCIRNKFSSIRSSITSSKNRSSKTSSTQCHNINNVNFPVAL